MLDELAQLGIEVHADGGELRFRPRSRMNPALAARVRIVKPEILAALAQRSKIELPGQRVTDKTDASLFAGSATSAKSRQPARRRTATTDRSTLPSVVSVAGQSETPKIARPQSSCYCCGKREFMRVSTGPCWVCATCHPALPFVEVLERWTVGGRS